MGGREVSVSVRDTARGMARGSVSCELVCQLRARSPTPPPARVLDLLVLHAQGPRQLVSHAKCCRVVKRRLGFANAALASELAEYRGYALNGLLSVGVCVCVSVSVGVSVSVKLAENRRHSFNGLHDEKVRLMGDHEAARREPVLLHKNPLDSNN